MQRSRMVSHCPGRMGCSMECSSISESRFSFSRAWGAENAPLASTRNSMVSAEYSFLMVCRISNSDSKSRAPIFSLMHRNPCSSFSCTCRSMNSLSPIHIRPLIGIRSSPLVKSEGNSSKGCLAERERSACSRPNAILGYRPSWGKSWILPPSSSPQTHWSWSSYPWTSSQLSPFRSPHSPIPILPWSSRMRNQLSFSVRIPLEVPLGRLKFRVYLRKVAFMQLNPQI